MARGKYHYLIKLQYDGHNYHGWQKQKHFPTIQGVLEETLLRFIETDIFTFGASRTDSGVHALSQYFKLSLNEKWNPAELKQKWQEELPKEIELLEVCFIDPRFKVALSVIEKEYRYYFTSGRDKNATLISQHAVHYQEELNYEEMNLAIKEFIGVHSFHNFQYRSDTKSGYIREIFHVEILRNVSHPFHPEIYVDAFVFRGNGFLKQMVRLMVGTLINIGIGTNDRHNISKSLQPQSNLKLGFIVPSYGLFLEKIVYPNYIYQKINKSP